MQMLMVIQTIHHFNSQPHKEADWYLWITAHRTAISTHSLTRRLTFGGVVQEVYRLIFQLTASQGG